MMSTHNAFNIDEPSIWETLKAKSDQDAGHIREILTKARELKGINFNDIAALSHVSDPTLLGELFETARYVKDIIYGKRLVIFAPLYISNLCANECTYCAFRARNKEVRRRALSQEEIAQETRIIIDQGHKRVLLVAGESYPKRGFEYVLDAIDTVYSVKHNNGEIRRVNVNIAPLKTEEFKLLHEAKSALTSSSRKPTTVKPMARCTFPAKRRITAGACRPSIVPWRPASTIAASASSLAYLIGASNCWR